MSTPKWTPPSWIPPKCDVCGAPAIEADDGLPFYECGGGTRQCPKTAEVLAELRARLENDWADSGWIKEQDGLLAEAFEIRYWIRPGHVVKAVVGCLLGSHWYVAHNGKRVSLFNEDMAYNQAKEEALAVGVGLSQKGE